MVVNISKNNRVAITVCGHYANGGNKADGQTIKTQELIKELSKKYGNENINIVDTYLWKRRPFSVLLKCINAVRISSDIIIMPAHKGLRVFIPLFSILSIGNKIQLHYVVIGGWLKDSLIRHPTLVKKLKRFKGIYVETSLMKHSLYGLDLKNSYILYNFKDITPVKTEEVEEKSFDRSLPICTLSRVTRNKGIEEAINAVSLINSSNDGDLYTLDIYGPIDKDYEHRFFSLLENSPDYIKYRGVVDSKDAVDVIAKYYLLLFPTLFRTEGIPGTIIDAYAAGVPVIASKWNSSAEVVENGYNGILHRMGSVEDLRESLVKCLDGAYVKKMSINAHKTFDRYLPANALQNLYNNIDESKK